jgi:hypothetical protein
MKKVLLILIVAGIAAVTLPLWGSCDLNAKACRSWCSVRHFNSDMKTAACQARCTSDELSCLANQGVKDVEGFFEELSK